MKHWMFRCDQVSQKISQGLDAPQTLGARILIRMHLWMCRHCSRVYAQLHQLRRISRYNGADASDCPPDLPATLSPEACQRIKEKLRHCK
jgi:predicted anti-sigma-YlaC factor YlaD